MPAREHDNQSVPCSLLNTPMHQARYETPADHDFADSQRIISLSLLPLAWLRVVATYGIFLLVVSAADNSREFEERINKSFAAQERQVNVLRKAIAKKYLLRNANVLQEVIEALKQDAFLEGRMTTDDLRRIFGSEVFQVDAHSIGVPLERGLNQRPDMGPSRLWYLIGVVNKDGIVAKFFLQYGYRRGLVRTLSEPAGE